MCDFNTETVPASTAMRGQANRARATMRGRRLKTAMMNLAYNMPRFVLLCKREIYDLSSFDRKGASAVA